MVSILYTIQENKACTTKKKLNTKVYDMALEKGCLFSKKTCGVSVDTKSCWTGTSRSVLVGLRVYCRIGSVTLVLAYLSCIKVFHSVEVPCSCGNTWECARSRSFTFHHLALDWLLWSTLYHLTSDWLCWSLVWSIWCTSTPAAIQSFIDFFLRVARSSKSSSPSEGLETQPRYMEMMVLLELHLYVAVVP